MSTAGQWAVEWGEWRRETREGQEEARAAAMTS